MNPFNKRIGTERLILRQLSLNDTDDMYEFTSSSLVTQHLEWKHHTEKSQPKKFIMTTINKYKTDQTSYTWGIELINEHKLIGVIRIYDFLKSYRRAEISYVLNPLFQGKGYMYEALNAVISYCFETLNLKRIQGKCSTQNIKSTRLMENVGMKREGIMRQFFIINGSVQDALLLSIIDQDYNK